MILTKSIVHRIKVISISSQKINTHAYIYYILYKLFGLFLIKKKGFSVIFKLSAAKTFRHFYLIKYLKIGFRTDFTDHLLDTGK